MDMKRNAVSLFELNYFKMFYYYCQDKLSKKLARFRENSTLPTHILLLFVDHFEPGNNPGRVEKWLSAYRKQINGHYDSDGIAPQHTWFYPCEQLDFGNLKNLAESAFDGLGEIELHLHHQNDTSQSLTYILKRGIAAFSQVGALINEKNLRPEFGFIHGNWALDNSRGSSFCGVNDEISILRRLGCYGDFTFPSKERDSQPRKLNSIYYAIDDPKAPKSYDCGHDLCKWQQRHGDLLMIQGPWEYDWKRRKFGIFPYVDCGDIAPYDPPSLRRLELWLRSNVHVLGCGNWRFIKIHTHGAHLRHMSFVLGNDMKEIYRLLETKYNDNENYVLHYVTSREAYNIIKAAEDGKGGNPNEYRDYIIPKPLNRKMFSNALYDVYANSDNSYTLGFKETKQVKLRFKQELLEMRGDIESLTCFKNDKNKFLIQIRSNAEIISCEELNIKGNFAHIKKSQLENKYCYCLSK